MEDEVRRGFGVIAPAFVSEARWAREATFAAGQPMQPVAIASRGDVRAWVRLGQGSPEKSAIDIDGAALIALGCGLRADRLGYMFDGIYWPGMRYPVPTTAFQDEAPFSAVCLVDATRDGERNLSTLPYRVGLDHVRRESGIEWDVGAEEDLLPISGWIAAALDEAFHDRGTERLAGFRAEDAALTDLTVARYLVDLGHRVRLFGRGDHLRLAEQHEMFCCDGLSIRLAP